MNLRFLKFAGKKYLNQTISGINHRKSVHLTYVWDSFQGTIYQINSKVYMLKDWGINTFKNYGNFNIPLDIFVHQSNM
jgi:hypothetical protein